MNKTHQEDDMSHTPGPWAVAKSHDGFRTVSNGSKTICTVGEADLFPQIEDDAALIAAAPELLRIAKRLHSLMESGDIDGRDWTEFGQLDSIISQAGGKDS